MAPHLTPAELDHIHALEQAGKTPIAIHAALATARRRKRMHAPCLVNVRRALEGKTYKRGLKETRGRKRLYSRKAVLKMDKVRKQLIKKAANDREVLWRDIRRASRVPPGDRTTLKKAFDREGIPVAARRPREKPQRSREHKADRLKFAQAMAGKPPSYYESSLDMIIDNKKFDIPTTERARLHMKSQRVRFHLRWVGGWVGEGGITPDPWGCICFWALVCAPPAAYSHTRAQLETQSAQLFGPDLGDLVRLSLDAPARLWLRFRWATVCGF